MDISRKAELYETSSGMLTITGGKLTTWRRMAKQVVDRMVEREGRQAPCRTADLPLGMPASDEDLAALGDLGVADHDGTAELLRFRYGQFSSKLLRMAAEQEGLGEPIVEGMPDLMAEVLVAARYEQARSVGRRSPAPDPARHPRRATASHRRGGAAGRRRARRRARLVRRRSRKLRGSVARPRPRPRESTRPQPPRPPPEA